MKLTNNQIAKQLALKQYHDELNSRPEFIEKRKMVQEMWSSDDAALCGFAANLLLENELLSKENGNLVERLNKILLHSNDFFNDEKFSLRMKQVFAHKILEIMPENTAALVYSQKVKFERAASKRGRNAANALHNKPGGSREKQASIREAWASGKYNSRDICAEQECAALKMSFSAARKALRGTPKPT